MLAMRLKGVVGVAGSGRNKSQMLVSGAQSNRSNRPLALRSLSVIAKRLSQKIGVAAAEALISETSEAITPEVFSLAPELLSSAEPSESVGLVLHSDGEASFRVWAPHAARVSIALKGDSCEVPLSRQGDFWAARLTKGLSKGDSYKVLVHTHDGQRLDRRDPYARSTDYDSSWCYVDDAKAFEWSEHELRPFDEVIIYEMHVGSFTPEGTLASAMEKLEYIADLGFTQVQLMPLTEHSDAWGYNPRQLMSLHGAYGTPDDLRRFVR